MVVIGEQSPGSNVRTCVIAARCWVGLRVALTVLLCEASPLAGSKMLLFLSLTLFVSVCICLVLFGVLWWVYCGDDQRPFLAGHLLTTFLVGRIVLVAIGGFPFGYSFDCVPFCSSPFLGVCSVPLVFTVVLMTVCIFCPRSFCWHEKTVVGGRFQSFVSLFLLHSL